MSRLTLLVCVLAVASGCEFLKNPTEPAPPVPANEIRYTAIGASDAIGIGASVPCLPFSPCPTGTGYVQTLARQLENGGKTVTLMNLGLPSAVLGPETQQLGASIGLDIFGNFLEREVPFVPRDTTVVTVFAGGNDVNTVGSALKRGQGGSNPTGFIQTQTQNFSRDLNALVTGIRGRAPDARIVILNLPNMAAMPYNAGLSLQEKQVMQQISVAFSAQINALTAQNVLVIDLMCDSAMYQASMFSSDGFHPNDAGYARLAALAFGAASTGTSSAPRSGVRADDAVLARAAEVPGLAPKYRAPLEVHAAFVKYKPSCTLDGGLVLRECSVYFAVPTCRTLGPTMPVLLLTSVLLICSNVFMTFAWYAHLKNLSAKPWIVAVLVSWGIAFFEYLLQVPANRIGYTTLDLAQLKVLQEVITLAVFVPFAVYYMKQPVKLDFLWAGLCLLGRGLLRVQVLGCAGGAVAGCSCRTRRTRTNRRRTIPLMLELGVRRSLDPRVIDLQRTVRWITAACLVAPSFLVVVAIALHPRVPFWLKIAVWGGWLGGRRPAGLVRASLAADRVPLRVVPRRRPRHRDPARRRLARGDERAANPRAAHRRLAGAARTQPRPRHARDSHRRHRARDRRAQRARLRDRDRPPESPAARWSGRCRLSRRRSRRVELIEHRLHPASILFNLAGQAKELLVPGLIVLFSARRGDAWEFWGMFLLIPYVFVAVARYRTFRYRYEERELAMRWGLVFRKERHIPYTRIQNLDAAQNPFHRLFGVATVRLETGGGDEPEARMSVLPLGAFDEMRRRVFEARAEAAAEPVVAAADAAVDAPPAVRSTTLLQLSPRALMAAGLIENRGMVLIAAALGVIWEAGLGDSLMDRIFGEQSPGRGPLRRRLFRRSPDAARCRGVKSPCWRARSSAC